MLSTVHHVVRLSAFPHIVRERLRGFKDERQGARDKIVLAASVGAFVLLLVAMALDTRGLLDAWPTPTLALPRLAPAVGHTGWGTPQSFARAAFACVLNAVGIFGVRSALTENQFARPTVSVTTEQKVITTGLYAWVRHPMYTFIFFMYLSYPVVLGSTHGLLMVFVVMLGIAVRIAEEERVLVAELDGYDAYRKRVRYKACPPRVLTSYKTTMYQVL